MSNPEHSQDARPNLASQACSSDPPALEILLEDGPVLAVNKPAGLLTQGVPHGIPSLDRQVKAYLKERYHKPGNVYLGIPHRLDRPVSGVVVFARNSKAARRLAEQFQQRSVRKRYWGIVEQEPEPNQGVLRDWLVKVPDQARVHLVAQPTAGARECTLSYRVLREVAKGWLVEVDLGTGRMHQIRVQLAHRGWHLVGDSSYGARTRLLDTQSADPRSEPVALHAASLRLLHPVRYDPLTILAPVPTNWNLQGVEIDPDGI